MSGEWIQKSLGEVITLQRGHDLPSQIRGDGNVPIMGSAGITGYHNVAKEKGPGVVIGRSGNSMGEVHFTENNYWPLNTCLYVTDFKGNDERFIYYLLQLINFDQFNSGSAQKSLNRNAVYPFQVRLPESIEEQKQIAKTLSDVADKIALNRQINQTLEAMAQALFKSWFVDFEPVRAKVAALETGEDPTRAAMRTISGKTDAELDTLQTTDTDTYAQLEATTTLFPDALVESELGLVPEGWKIGVLEDLVVLQRGFDLPSHEREEGIYPIIAASGPAGFHSKPMSKAPGVVTGRSGVLGKVFLVLDDYWPLNTSLWVKDFKKASPHYGFYVLKQIDFKAFNAGSAVPSLNRNHVHSLPQVIPKKKCISLFESLVSSIHRKIKDNDTESQTLATLRDTLLPKLLSGELAVNDVGAGFTPAHDIPNTHATPAYDVHTPIPVDNTHNALAE